MAPADILAVVEDQFYDLRKRLDVQLTRTAQVQAQLDAQLKELAAQRAELADLHRAVDVAHHLLRQLVAKDP